MSRLGDAMVAGIRAFCAALENGEPIEDRFRVDTIRMVDCEQVAPYVYRVTSESEQYGRVTQNVLVFPREAIEGGATERSDG